MQSRSRVPSRAASPALSHRSRRSMMSSRHRQKYMRHDDLTDDEDSELEMFTDDSRSKIRKGIESLKHSRQHRKNEHLDLDYRDNEVINRIQRMKEKSKLIRERRSGSLTNWPTTAKERESGSLTPSDDEFRRLSTKFRKSSLTSPIPHKGKKIFSTDSVSEEERDDDKKKKKKNNVSKVTKSDSEGSASATKKVSNDNDKKSISENHHHPSSETKNNKTTTSSSTVAVKNKNEVNHTWETNKQHKQQEPQTPPPTIPTESLQSSSPSKKALPQISSEIPGKTIVTKASISSSVVPSSSSENWECQHCTFVNESDAKICTICCKTRVEVLKQLPTTIDDDEDIDINEINDSIIKSENEAVEAMKQKGKLRKITFLPGTKAR